MLSFPKRRIRWKRRYGIVRGGKWILQGPQKLCVWKELVDGQEMPSFQVIPPWTTRGDNVGGSSSIDVTPPTHTPPTRTPPEHVSTQIAALHSIFRFPHP